jgi:hypothetical protein
MKLEVGDLKTAFRQLGMPSRHGLQNATSFLTTGKMSLRYSRANAFQKLLTSATPENFTASANANHVLSSYQQYLNFGFVAYRHLASGIALTV